MKINNVNFVMSVVKKTAFMRKMLMLIKKVTCPRLLFLQLTFLSNSYIILNNSTIF
jgi:hypothetical protein